MIVARCRDVGRSLSTRWLVITRWGSFHLPWPPRRRGSAGRVLGELQGIMAGHGPEWQAVYFDRLRWYADHGGDMTGAPEFPED